MLELLQFFATSFVALFFVVDPFAAIPLLLSMTEGDSEGHRRATARKAAVTVAVVLLGFALAGGFVFRLFGIEMASFRIAGGILLFVMALDMMRARRSRTRTSDEEVAEGTDSSEVGTVPLGIPMMAGPGAMSTVTVLVESTKHSMPKLAMLALAVALTGLLSYIVLRGAEPLGRILKTTGLNILTRVMGLILAAVAVQIIVTGVHESFPGLR